MDFFKKILLLIMFSTSLFSFSKKAEIVNSDEYALLEKNSTVCNSEITEAVKEILSIKNIKLSKKLFIDNYYLDITNNIDVYKKFYLHFKGDSCYLSYVSSKDVIISSKKLQNCICKRVLKK